MTKKSHSSGFTLIELLLVISIVGILSSIVLTSVMTARQKSRDTQRISDMRQLRIALQLFYEANGQTYPISLNNLVVQGYMPFIPVDPLGNDNVVGGCRRQSAGWNGSGTNSYCYTFIAAGPRITYHLGAQLEQPNAVLNSDADCDSTIPTNCPITSTYSPTLVFNGADSPTRIYDIVPQ